jgi:hypothetical protein
LSVYDMVLPSRLSGRTCGACSSSHALKDTSNGTLCCWRNRYVWRCGGQLLCMCNARCENHPRCHQYGVMFWLCYLYFVLRELSALSSRRSLLYREAVFSEVDHPPHMRAPNVVKDRYR